MLKYQNKEWLYDQYWNQQLPMRVMAKNGNCGRRTIERWLKKFGIRIRTNSETSKGKNNPNWKGYRKKIFHKGYILIYKPKHYRANKAGYVCEHITIMEKIKGRGLWPKEAIHHIDGDRSNNNIDNLFLTLNNSQHFKLHSSLQKVAYQLVKEGIIIFDPDKKEYKRIE